MINVAISGASGRMGKALIRETMSAEDLALVAAFVSPGSKLTGKDSGENSGMLSSGVSLLPIREIQNIDVLIDFSNPSAIAENLEMCCRSNSGIVIGTTGLNADQNQMIANAARNIPVLYAANTSVGVNLCVSLVEMASRIVGDAMDIEIVETHHRNKADAPSGTALLLGEAAASAMDVDLDQCAVFSREGQTGARKSGSIGFSTIRGGDVAGEHTVMFLGENERIEITHRATDRKIFAQGAIKAARWLSKQQNGLFSMQDVLDLR